MTAIPVRRAPSAAALPDHHRWELVIDGTHSGRGPVIVVGEDTLVEFNTTLLAGNPQSGKRWLRRDDADETEAIARLLFAAPKLLIACRAIAALQITRVDAATELLAALDLIEQAIFAAEDTTPIPKADWL